MDLSAVIAGDRQIIARLEAFPIELHEMLRARIEALVQELEARVRVETPVGPTGYLQASVKSAVRDYPQKVVGRVFSNAAYASVIEFGIHKLESVRAHEQRLSHAWSRDISPLEVSVDPYTRLADVEARLFMRAGLQSMESQIVEQFQALIDQAAGAENV